MRCVALKLAGSLVEFSVSIDMEALGGLLSFNVHWSQKFYDGLNFWH